MAQIRIQVFQGLRMEVNSELEVLEDMLYELSMCSSQVADWSLCRTVLRTEW